MDICTEMLTQKHFQLTQQNEILQEKMSFYLFIVISFYLLIAILHVKITRVTRALRKYQLVKIQIYNMMQ